DLNLQAAKIGFEESETKKKDSSKFEAEYNQLKEKVTQALKEQYRPEFINRIDKIVVFKPLGYEEIKKITALQLKELSDHLKNQDITLQTNAQVIKFIADKSFDPSQGARLVRRNIQDLVEDPLAEKLITDKFKQGSTIKIKLQKEKLIFS
ncbi:MAG: ATP-dependent Clp protease ATP-binding subunit ClpC, partial [Patescibacteria group bacterium]